MKTPVLELRKGRNTWHDFSHSRLEWRVRQLESEHEREKSKGWLKQLTDNAGAVALLLGLVLTVSSLYDVFVRKPEADRIATISQFNQAVNAAAKIRQELIQQSQGSDPAARLNMLSMATPRVLNEIATARALLPSLEDRDVGIPQLLILISESMTAGDVASAGQFVDRAVGKKDVTPFMAAEARRYQGKVLFASGKPREGRRAYHEASTLLGDGVAATGAKAFNLADLIGMEFAVGDCAEVEDDTRELVRILGGQGVAAEVRAQLTGAVHATFKQFGGQRCPMPQAAALLVAAL